MKTHTFINSLFLLISLLASCSIKNQHFESRRILSELKADNKSNSLSEERNFVSIQFQKNTEYTETENVKNSPKDSTETYFNLAGDKPQSYHNTPVKRDGVKAWGLRDRAKIKSIEKNQSKRDIGDFMDVLEYVGWWVLILGLFFLMGLCLKLIFPKLSWLVAILLGVPVLFALLLLAAVIYVLAGGRVH
ncbi:MAG: hypothetical protein ACJ75J_09185 [Cytophagaceae bacterium]